jgi:integrase
MEGMSRPRPPHLQRETTRHGKTVWYFRKDDGPRTRIKGEYGSDEFKAAYEAAAAGSVAPDIRRKPSAASMAWLIERYRETSAWHDLARATRRQRENIFKGVIAAIGNEAFSDVDKASITASRDSRSETPAQARNFLDAMRGLFRWAVEAQHVTIDPTEGVKNPKRPRGGGFPVWTETDVDRYEEKWPEGTKERVWLHVLLYTGLRRGDAVRIGKQHVRDGVATITTEKSQGSVTVTIPILPILQTTLDKGPTGDLAFICGERGQPLVKESFGTMFRTACRDAGVKKSAHGVRKIGATRAAENGATEKELDAIFGWIGGGMAKLYTESANRARLSKGAASKLGKNAG